MFTDKGLSAIFPAYVIFAHQEGLLYEKMNSINPKFSSMKTTIEVKVVNKYIRVVCLARDNLSDDLDNFNYPTMPISSETDLFDNFSDVDEWEDCLCSSSSELDETIPNVQSPI